MDPATIAARIIPTDPRKRRWAAQLTERTA
jgi:hypothetical protein